MPTVFETLAAADNFSVLTDTILAVDETLGTDLEGQLNNAALGATIFAPSNDAFISAAQQIGYPGEDLDEALKYLNASFDALGDGDGAKLLAQVLTYHVATTELEDADLVDGATISTLLGLDITVAGGLIVDLDPESLDAGFGPAQAVDNGVIVPVDQLLLPIDVDPDAEPTNDADLIIGTDGNDVIDLLDGDDVLSAGDGDDVIRGDMGDDLIFGGAGNDRLIGEQGDDCLHGGEGNDAIFGLEDNDQIFGEAGDDRLGGGTGDDFVDGGEGNDTMFGGDGNDSLFGGTGDDTMSGGDGEDVIFGERGDDSIVGGGGADKLNAGSGDDVVRGGNGDDRVAGNSGDDRVFGGEGNDTVLGGSGDDFGTGGLGDDRMVGGSGNDEFNGEEGDDTIDGGVGDDILRTGSGNDTVTTGEGFDRLELLASDEGANTVTDFNTEEDTLALSIGEEDILSILTGQGDGNDTLITVEGNEAWSVLLENVDDLEEDDIELF